MGPFAYTPRHHCRSKGTAQLGNAQGEQIRTMAIARKQGERNRGLDSRLRLPFGAKDPRRGGKGHNDDQANDERPPIMQNISRQVDLLSCRRYALPALHPSLGSLALSSFHGRRWLPQRCLARTCPL